MTGTPAPDDLYRATIEALHEGVVVTDGTGRFLAINRAAADYLGLAGLDVIGQGLADLTTDIHVIDEHGEPAPAAQRPTATARRTGQPASDQLLGWHVGDLGMRWFIVGSRPLLDDDGRVSAVVTSFLDVTTQKHAADNARYEARHDALTGLVNRWGLRDMVRRVLERVPREGSDVALLYCDLDRFKEVNDSLGHAAGDELLREVAQRIRRAVRTSDLVARIGGDEVVAILDGVRGIEGAVIAAEKVRSAVARPVTVGGTTLVPHLSIGAALLPSFEQFDQTLNEADEAMYAAKAAGRNQVRTFGG